MEEKVKIVFVFRKNFEKKMFEFSINFMMCMLNVEFVYNYDN